MEILPDEVLAPIFARLDVADVLSLGDTCCSLNSALQRSVWRRVSEVYVDRFGALATCHLYWNPCGAPESLIYWNGRLYEKRHWRQLDPLTRSSVDDWLRVGWLQQSGPIPLPGDEPKLMMKLLRRCGSTVKTLVFSENSTRSSPFAETGEQEEAQDVRLLSGMLCQLPHLNSLATDCRMSIRDLLGLVASIQQLKQLFLSGCLWNPDKLAFQPPEYKVPVHISAAEFAKLLGVLPAIEHLSCTSTGVLTHLSLPAGTVPLLRSLRLDSADEPFLSGRQLRELVDNCPLLEELYYVGLSESPPKIWGVKEDADTRLSQQDIDYFCREAKRLKLLEISFSCFDDLHAPQGTLQLRGITSLEHLRLGMIWADAGSPYESPQPPTRYGFPFKDLREFPSLRSLRFPYNFDSEPGVQEAFAHLPPHLTRLSVHGNGGAPLTDEALSFVVSALGANGCLQLEQLALINSPFVTNSGITSFLRQCTRLRQFEHHHTTLDTTLDARQLATDLGTLLEERCKVQLQEMPPFRLIQYAHANSADGDHVLTKQHPLIMHEWRRAFAGLYAEQYHEIA